MNIRGYFLFPFLLVPSPSLSSSQCSEFWVSECHLDFQDEVILQVPLPSHSQDEAIKICQSLCNVQFDCTYWQWSGPQMTCTLLTYSYLSLCHNISSSSSPDLSTCISQDSGTCDDFVDEDCQMSGKVLWQSDAVIDAFACQEYLQLLGPVLGAEVFFYSDQDDVCFLLDSPDRSCISMSGPKAPSLEDCQDNEEKTTTTPRDTSTTTTTATSHSSVAVGGVGGILTTINAEGKCARTSMLELPVSYHNWPASISWHGDSVVGCGANSCTGEISICQNMYDDCYSYDTNTKYWKKIRSPTDLDYNSLNVTWSLSYDTLVNINKELYIFFGSGSVQVYSEEDDIWTEVTKMPRGIGFPDGHCIVDLGNNEFFIRSSYWASSSLHVFHYKVNVDSNTWTRLPVNINFEAAESHCLKVDLLDGGTGVMLVGGKSYSTQNVQKESKSVEIFNLSSLIWEEKPSINEKWIQTFDSGDESSAYAFIYLDDKPTLIGRFNDTDKNVMEQYNIAEDAWSLEYFDMTDPPCGVNFPCMTNFVNIPAELFAVCD